MTGKHFILTITSLLLAVYSLSAQTFQAENYTYHGSVQNGCVFIENEGDYVQITFSLSQSAEYDIYIGYQSPYGNKEMTISVNGVEGTIAIPSCDYTQEVKYATLTLPAGSNTIRISEPWTWFYVDYLRIQDAQGGEDDDTYISDHGFIVKGTQLLDAKNNPFVIRGTNLAYAWYTRYGYTSQISQMRSRGANAVRIALGCGSKYDNVDASTLNAIISYCEQQKMIAILEVHDVTGSDKANDLNTATNYWISMLSTLKGHEHTVIINIANEWGGTWDSDAWFSAYSTAIQNLRQAGIEHCLMIDTDGWGQHAVTIPNKGKALLNADPDKNIIFSIHMYGTAGKQGAVESNINNVLNQGLSLCIGEFGWYHSDGDIDEDAIISTCHNKNVGWCAWSWWGNGGGVDYLDMVSDQYNGTPATQTYKGNTCAWGQKIYDAWNQDAQLCSVYTNAPSTDIQDTYSNPTDEAKVILRNGQLFIQRGEHIYTLQGQPIQ